MSNFKEYLENSIIEENLLKEKTITGKIKYTNLHPEKSKDPLRYQIKLEIKDMTLMFYYLALAKNELFKKKPVEDRHYPELGKSNLTWDKSDLGNIKTLDQPGWKPHVTVNWKDTPKNLENWGLGEGEKAEVKVESTKIFRESQDYLFIVVQSPELERLRVALGLSPKPSTDRHGFHLTLALVNQVEMQERRTQQNLRKKGLIK